MKDKWIVTLEIDTYDGDPKSWDWSELLGETDWKVIETYWKGRVLQTGESK